MSRSVGDVMAKGIDGLVTRIVVPITGAIPFLVSSGILLVAYAALWLIFGLALATSPGALDDSWRSIQQLPLPVQGVAWLLGLPLMAGLWAWETDWPVLVRLAVVAGLAGWNLLVFVPRRQPAREAGAGA